MFKTPIFTSLTFAAFLAVPIISEAAVSIPINANSNCLDTSGMSGGAARFQLPPGRYVASIINNQMSACPGGASACLTKSVIVKAVNTSAGSTARWGLAVETPTVIDVPSPTNVDFVAFIVDTICSDNSGQATLRFQKAQ